MPFWPPKSVQQLLIASFFMALLPFCIAIMFTVQTLGELVDSNRNVTRKVVEITRLGREIQRDVLDLERRAFQYIALSDADLAELFERERAVLLDKLWALQDRLPPKSPEISALAEYLEQLQLFVTVAPEAELDNTQSPPEDTTARSFAAIGEQERDVQRWLQVSINELLEKKATEADAIIEALMLQIGLLVVATMAMLLFFALWINRPVKHLIQEIDQLGTAGLSHKIEISGPLEVRALSTKLDWLRQNLHKTEQQKQQFLRHVSHELKTPLSSLREGTELLSDEVTGRLSRQQREIVEIARKNGIELQRLIENLLDYNRVPEQKLDYEEVEIAALWQDILSNYQLMLDKKALQLDLHGDIDYWVADRATLRTALDNLLSNAVNYTPEHGRIDIAWCLKDANLMIDVANSGDPIPDEDAERVFEPFEQSTARRSGPIKGSGLGLSVARECIQAQGGSLSLVAHETFPTCFRLICPAH